MHTAHVWGAGAMHTAHVCWGLGTQHTCDVQCRSGYCMKSERGVVTARENQEDQKQLRLGLGPGWPPRQQEQERSTAVGLTEPGLESGGVCLSV